MKKLIMISIIFSLSTLGMGKKRLREATDSSPTPSVASSPYETPNMPAPITYYCTIFNALSRNYCNQPFEEVEAFKRHLKIQHMRLPKNFNQYWSKKPQYSLNKK